MKRFVILLVLFFSVIALHAQVKLNILNQTGLTFSRVIVFTEMNTGVKTNVKQSIDTLKYANTLTFNKAKRVTLYFEGDHDIVGICYGIDLAKVKTLKLNNETMVEVSDHRKLGVASATDNFSRTVSELDEGEIFFNFINKTHYDIYAIHLVVGQTQYGNALFCDPKNRLKQQEAREIYLIEGVSDNFLRKIGDKMELRFIGVDANSTMHEFRMEVNPQAGNVVITPQTIQSVQRKSPSVVAQSGDKGLVRDDVAQSGNVYEFDDVHHTAKLIEYNDNPTSSVIVIPDIAIKDGKEYRITRIGGDRYGGGAIRNRKFLQLFFSKTLESIEKNTMKECSLSCVTFGENLKRIEEGAIEECSGLYELTLPNNPCVIEKNAIKLEWEYGIRKLYVPEKADNIPFLAFSRDRENLKVVVDKNNPNFCVEKGIIYSKKKDAIYYCPAEYSGALTIPTNVRKIGDAAFCRCGNLTSITIPNSVREIGEGAFYLCGKVTSFNIPDGVKEIKSGTFSNCYALESVILPSSVTKLGDGVFEKCYKLRDMVLPNGVAEIGRESFRFCPIDTLRLPDSLRVVGDAVFCFSRIKHFEFPEGVTEIGSGAFSRCDSLRSVSLPNSLRKIGRAAFARCGHLESVLIPDSVNEIQYAAFAECERLSDVTLSGGMKVICTHVFSKCSALTEVRVPEGVEAIQNEAFENCLSLKTILLPASLRKIEQLAFDGCDALTTISITDRNTFISYQDGVLFNKEKTKLIMCLFPKENYTIPKSVTEIGKGAFLGCDKMKSIVIPSSVKRIGDEAFFGCAGLTRIVMPKSVEEIGERLFGNCVELTSVVLSPNIQVIPKLCFYRCKNLEKIVLPKKLSEVKGQSFESCVKLVSVTMPKSVKSLNGSAFSKCENLQELFVPKTCEIMWKYNIPNTTQVKTY